MTILSGELPVHAGSEIIAPNVVAYVDGWRFEGINVWANWIDYLRSRDRVAAPTLVLEEMEVHPDSRVSIRGRWQGVLDDRVVTSKPGVATYRLERGRIVEIWSTRRNYAFLCGAHVEYFGGFALELLRSQWYRKRVPRLDLLGSSHARPATLPTTGVATSLLVAAD
jgi:hypothetical protein